MYDKEDSIEDKITKIAMNLYGAKKVEFSTRASSDIAKIKKILDLQTFLFV